MFWKIVYKIYPPFLRVLEKIGVHKKRQKFFIGKLRGNVSFENFKKFLFSENFESAILAWKDPHEILSLRKIDSKVFQYHLRLYSDREITGHYEYSSEGNPWRHIVETVFEPKEEYFKKLLADFLEL